MNTIKFFAIAVFAMFLTACGTVQKKEIIIQDKLVAVVISEEHFKTPSVPAPMDPDKLRSLTPRQYIVEQNKYISDLYLYTGSLKIQIEKIKKAMLSAAEVIDKREKESKVLNDALKE